MKGTNMNNKITLKLKEAMDSLDKIADTYGVARSMHITQAASALIEVNREVAALMKELEELRKFKAEQTECTKEEKEAV